MPDGSPAQPDVPATQASIEPAEWYADGLRFSCTQCGNCCTGPPGYVWFTPEEGRAMAEELGLTEETFLDQYTRREGARRSLNERATKHGQDCVFLDRTTYPGRAVCSIYKSRPMQCRTWPFWPENLRSRSTWERVKRHTPCPGMDSGRLVPIESIRIQRDASR
ncbi:MAG: YkgJ family cysteine cluster protein [Phycisphaeraceae bacterium]|nr:YkgJ family cysteine cluster protein [Phycisphaerales bacterium]QOJ16205.1 MAG: YkgJ family cysteine cluster protein [Phycisphaeraceae bacterium]